MFSSRAVISSRLEPRIHGLHLSRGRLRLSFKPKHCGRTSQRFPQQRLQRNCSCCRYILTTHIKDLKSSRPSCTPKTEKFVPLHRKKITGLIWEFIHRERWCFLKVRWRSAFESAQNISEESFRDDSSERIMWAGRKAELKANLEVTKKLEASTGRSNQVIGVRIRATSLRFMLFSTTALTIRLSVTHLSLSL